MFYLIFFVLPCVSSNSPNQRLISLGDVLFNLIMYISDLLDGALSMLYVAHGVPE